MSQPDSDRRAQLAESLAAIRSRVDAACAAAGRPRDEVSLLPVTKFFPASDAALLYDLGCRELGESRSQEAELKAAQVRDSTGGGVRWHMIGRLQRNKVNSVVRWASVVHSVDRLNLVGPLANAAARADRELEVLIQISLDGDPERGGVVRSDLRKLGAAVAESSGLRLTGVMAIAPLSGSDEAAFATLAEIVSEFQREFPFASEVSAGMSNDLELAIKYGSTCVRVGTAVMGPRPITSL